MDTNLVKPVRHGDQIEVEVSTLAFGGDAVGRYQDFAIFVPGALPGERVRVKINQVKDHYASSEIQAILRPSPDRVVPTCAIFEECGGCQWQHFSYPRQLQAKRQFVVDALQRIGRLTNVTVQPCLPSASPYAYRNKAMPVVSMRDGHFISGIYEPRSHHLVPYHTCPIQGDPINDLIQKVLKKIDRSGLTPYQEKKHTGFLRHLAIRQGVKTGELLLAFVTRSQVPEDRLQKPMVVPEELDQMLPRIARELMAEVPGLVGVLQNINASRTNIVFGATTNVLEGRDHYYEVIDGLKLKVSLRSFLQVNTTQADILHEIVREALGDPVHKKKWGTILDLYSGIGTLAMAVANKADYVVGVEEIGAAVEDAKINAGANHRTNIDFLEGDVASILLGLKDKGLSQVDAVILDPPRKGVLPEILARLVAFHPERLVYVSCDPSTLARDLALLAKHGYAVDWAQPLDMFPQTYHVETVVKLTRETPLPPEILSQTQSAQLEPFRLNKPEEPASLNISANFNAFKEKNATLFLALAQNSKAAWRLFVSLVAGFFILGVKVLRGLAYALAYPFLKVGPLIGKAAVGSFRLARKIVWGLGYMGRSSLSAVNRMTAAKPASPVETSSATAPLTEEEQIHRILMTETVIVETEEDVTAAYSVEVEEAPAASAFAEASADKPMSAPLQTEIPEPIQATPVEISEPVVTYSVPVEPSVEEQAPTEPVFLEPVLSEPVADEPVLSEAVPEEPASAFAKASADMPPVPQSLGVGGPVPPKVREPWKFPRIALPSIQIPAGFYASKRLRWTMASALLVGGGLVAMATLGPEGKKNPALVPTVSQAIPDVIAVMPTRNFLRYEMVPFELRVNSDDMPNFSEMRASVVVTYEGSEVEMVDGHTKLNLKKDGNKGRFTGNWPIPYNPNPGTYVAQVVVSGPQWTSPKIFESAFTIASLKPHGMDPGYTALTMEGGKQLINGAVPALDGSDSMKASNAIQWAQFMGANVFCYLMGQTSIWDHLNPREFPFSHGDREVGHKYAKAAHAVGMKFAAYMTTFKVIGDAWNQAPYNFALGYDADDDAVVPTRFISTYDTKRRQDIIDYLKDLDKDPDIDMVGLDYVRMGFGGFEVVDEFVKDLDVPLPPKFWSMTKEERIHWLARTVSQKEDKEVVSLFNWWRAHRVALTLKQIIEDSKISKPVFTFTLGWEMGHQHGQDPAMYVDAGISYNHIMLYEGDRGTLQSMKKQWPDYLARGNGMYAPGEMVDYNWVQKSIDPPGPEELYNREVETMQNWFSVNSSLGMFWHDLYRQVWGIRGPYSSMEWLIAGGKAFTTLRQAEGLSPIEVHLMVPKTVPAGVMVPISVEIHNHSPENLNGVVLHQLDTTKNYVVDLATVGPFDLPSGNMVRVKSLYVNIPREDHPERDNRWMAAVMVEKPGQPLRAFDFAYVRKIQAGSSVRHLDSATDQETDTSHKPSGTAEDDNH